MRYELITFPASVAERVSGLSKNMQRDWRKRGFLPPADGKAKFDFFDIAQMSLQKALADIHLGPKASSEWGPILTIGVSRKVLAYKQSWEGFDRASQADRSKWCGEILERRSADLAGEAGIFDLHFTTRADFFVHLSDGSSVFVDDIGAFFLQRQAESGGGPFIVFDMQLAANKLVRDLGPMARVVEE